MLFKKNFSATEGLSTEASIKEFMLVVTEKKNLFMMNQK